MKKQLCLVSLILIILLSFNSIVLAVPRTIDINELTIEELDRLTSEIETEKKKATDVTSEVTSTLEKDFMNTVEALMPNGTKFSYPFFGLSIVHRRNYYCVCGTVGCKLPDKTKKDLWDATIIYWYEAEKRKFHQAAFYTNDEVYFVDDYALSQVEANLESVARDNLKKHSIVVKKLDIAKATDLPNAISTPTKEPTPEATMQVTPIPTPIITTAPTPTTTPVFIPTETPAPVTFADIVLHDMTNEELEHAITALKQEQRARIKTKITLTKTSVVLNAGKTEKLEAKILELPEGEKEPTLEWISSDKKIVTCQNGVVKAVSEGKAIITCQATLKDGTFISESCEIQVNIPVTSISVDKKSISLKGGERYSPTYSFKPKNASITKLSFESSDKTIATVNEEGIIEGTGNGSATITAKTTDGSNKSISITVKVVDHRITKETALKVVLTAIGNDQALDIFTPDGNNFDKKKFHGYSYAKAHFKIMDDGTWTSTDGNVWHVSKLVVQNKEYSGYSQYDFDVRYDGKYYYAENGWRVSAGRLQWLDKTDTSKYGEDNLSNMEFYTYFTVKPEQLEN